MVDLSNISDFYGLFLTIGAAVLYSGIAYGLSGEKFSVRKFLTTILISIAMSLGITVTGATADIYANSLASTITSLLLSKTISKVKPITEKQKEVTGTVVNAVNDEVNKPVQ